MTEGEKYSVLKHALEKDGRVKASFSPGAVVLDNLLGFKSFLHRLSGIPEFYELAHDLLSGQQLKSNKVNVPFDEGMQFFKKALDLYIRAEVLASLLRPPTERENSVRVKLPNGDVLSDVVTSLANIDLSLNQNITHPAINGKLVVDRWESGSLWLTICVCSGVALSFVAALAWAAAVIAKKIQEARMFDQHVQSLKIKNTSLEDIATANKQMLDLMVESEARQLQAEFFANNEDPERTERLKFAVKTLSSMIADGAEIHPALNAPETVKNLFPDFKKLPTLASRIKQITENAGEGKA